MTINQLTALTADDSSSTTASAPIAYGVLIRERCAATQPSGQRLTAAAPITCDVLTYLAGEELVESVSQLGTAHELAAIHAQRWAHDGHRVVWVQLSPVDAVLYIDPSSDSTAEWAGHARRAA